ncbi:MAG: hypothetical protein EXX96DRAFT_563840 [Benjaminiella poitrasii]|nr:MAG: hypothetical protein EXX96DRAFT_563840 [Benjaminiella poitrasii]
MPFASCFWALLSLEKFEFIYLPKYIDEVQIAFGVTMGDILKSRSLLDFIHPDELSLAATDLVNFVQTKTLAGAITRCRLRSIKSLAYTKKYGRIKEDRFHDHSTNDNDESMNWVITDVVTYTATNRVLLTFFHTETSCQNTAYCGSEIISTNEIHDIQTILQHHSLSKSLRSVIEDKPFRLFQIYYTNERRLLISWPPSFDKNKESYYNNNTVVRNFDSNSSSNDTLQLLYNNHQKPYSYYHMQQENTFLLDLVNTLTAQEIDKRTAQSNPSLPGIASYAACIHHTHSTSTVMIEPFGLCQVEKIIIVYGNLTFSSFQITPFQSTVRPLPLPSSIIMTTEQQEKDLNMHRISNINDIRNDGQIILPSPALLSKHNSATIPQPNTKELEQYSYRKQNEIALMTEPETNSRGPLLKTWRSRFGIQEKKCENCQTSTSPEWRRGPSGHKT